MKNLFNLCPPYCHAILLAGSIIFSSAAFAQSGQKYATGGNNLNSNDKLGSKNNAPLRFVTDDVERARISETGLFGIGTTTPNATLTVNGTFKFTDGNQQNGYVLTTDGNGLATWQSLSTNNTGLWQQNGNDIFYNNGNVSAGNDLTVGNRLDVGSFFKAGNDTVEITSNYSAINSGMFCIGGLMGVGGTVPTVELDVKGDFKLTGNSEIQGTLSLPALADTADNIVIVNSIGNLTAISADFLPSPNLQCSPKVIWGLNGPNAALCEGANVGVGTLNPTAKMHVIGNGLFTSRVTIGDATVNTNTQLRVAGNTLIGKDNNLLNNGFLEVNSAVGDNIKAAQFENENNSRIFFVPQLSGFGFSQLSQQNDIGIIWSDANGFNNNAGLVIAPHGLKQGLRMTKDGDIGIGLSNPEAKLHVDGTVIIGEETQTSGSHTDYQLAVDGKIVSKKAIVTEDNWADFVFSDNYKRPTPVQKHTYTQKHKHLMYLPSEKEITTNGLDVGKTMKGITQNVEENVLDIHQLYLRLEKLEAENKVLKAEVEQLKKH